MSTVRAWRFANALARYDKDDEDKFRSSVAQALQTVSGGGGTSSVTSGGSGALEVDSNGALIAAGVNALNLSNEFVATVTQSTPTVIVAVSLATTQPNAHTWSAAQTFSGHIAGPDLSPTVSGGGTLGTDALPWARLEVDGSQVIAAWNSGSGNCYVTLGFTVRGDVGDFGIVGIANNFFAGTVANDFIIRSNTNDNTVWYGNVRIQVKLGSSGSLPGFFTPSTASGLTLGTAALPWSSAWLGATVVGADPGGTETLRVGGAAVLNVATAYLRVVGDPGTADRGGLLLNNSTAAVRHLKQVATFTGSPGTSSRFRLGWVTDADKETFLNAGAAVEVGPGNNILLNAGGTGFIILGADPGGGGLLRVGGTTRLNDTVAIAFDPASATAASFNVGDTASRAGVTQAAANFFPTFGSAVTSEGRVLRIALSTAAAAFTMTSGVGIHILSATKGAGSTITTQYGMLVDDQTQGGTNFAIFTGTGDVSFGDRLLLRPSASKIVPGVTSLSFRNTADSADNILVSNAGIVTLRNDLTVSALGTLDSSGTRFGGVGSLTTYDLLSYDGAVAKWRPRLLQTSFNAGVVAASALSDGTFLAAANSNPALPADPGTNPGTPNTPTLIPIYQGMIVDVSNTALPANELYVIDYSVNGGAFTSNAIVGTGARFVHSGLDSTKTYAYKVKIHYSVSNFTLYSAATAATNPSNVTETNAYGIILASQIATIYLSAITANLGLITAGQIRNVSKTGVIQLDTTFALDAAAVNGIFFAGANPIPGQITGLGIDFTATGTNPLLKASKLALNADGSAQFNGTVDVTASYTDVQSWWVSLRDLALAHGMTAIAPTTMFGALSEDPINGGLRVTSLTANSQALRLEAWIATAAAIGAVQVIAGKKSGTNVTALASTDQIFNILNNTNNTPMALLAGGNVTFGGTVAAASGAVTAPSFTFSAETNSGIYRAAASDLRFAVNGADVTQWTAGVFKALVGGSTTFGRVSTILAVTGGQTTTSTGDVSLTTVSLPANALSATTHAVRIRAAAHTSGGSNLNNLNVKFGATVIGTTPALTGLTEMFIDVVVRFLTSTTQTAFGVNIADTDLGLNIDTDTQRTAPGETLTSAVTIDIRGKTSGVTLTVDYVIVEVLAQ